jgi:CpeS-like protein
MLSTEDFFAICVGRWQTDRIYHYHLHKEVERSYTEFNAKSLTFVEKHQISSSFIPREFFRIDLLGFGLARQGD